MKMLLQHKDRKNYHTKNRKDGYGGVLRILDISGPGHLDTRNWTVRDLDETIFLTDHNCLVLINCQYFCTNSSLIYMNQK